MKALDRPHRVQIPKVCPICGETVGPCGIEGHGPQHLISRSHLCDAPDVDLKAILRSLKREAESLRAELAAPISLPRRPTYDPAFP